LAHNKSTQSKTAVIKKERREKVIYNQPKSWPIRLLIIIILSLASLIGFGILYSRVYIEVIPIKKEIIVNRTINISNFVGNQLIYSIWIEGGEESRNSFYPEYIDLAIDQNNILAISRRDLEKIIIPEVEKDILFDYKIDKLDVKWKNRGELTNYRHLDVFSANLEVALTISAIIDTEMIKANCENLYILFSNRNLERCLNKEGNLSKANVKIHPYFAYKLPIARAIFVDLAFD